MEGGRGGWVYASPFGGEILAVLDQNDPDAREQYRQQYGGRAPVVFQVSARPHPDEWPRKKAAQELVIDPGTGQPERDPQTNQPTGRREWKVVDR